MKILKVGGGGDISRSSCSTADQVSTSITSEFCSCTLQHVHKSVGHPDLYEATLVQDYQSGAFLLKLAGPEAGPSFYLSICLKMFRLLVCMLCLS